MTDAPATSYFEAFDRHYASLPQRTRDLVEAAGFEMWNSGGNLMVFSRFPDGEGGDQIMVSDINNEIEGDPSASIWQIGRYGEDGGRIDVDENFPLEEALQRAMRLPSPGTGPDAIDETFPTFEAAVASGASPTSGPVRA